MVPGVVMSTRAKLIGFAAGVAALFGVGLAAGNVLDPDAPVSEAESAGHGAGMAMSADAEHGEAMPVRGLAGTAAGLRLVVDDTALRRDATETIAFRVVEEDGTAVRDFEVEHARRMHLIVVRRDLTGFQHLHPAIGADGTWTTPVRLPKAGSYRLYADFVHDGEPVTLAADLGVDGAADLRPLPAPRALARTDGYDVRLAHGAAHAGEEAELRFEISRGGEAVEVDPYLGADGHLVVLREGDLAFLHVHPSEDGTGAGGEAVSFEATLPTAGRYRMFLQFRHDGRVHTAAFTEEVE
jgi:hypothetical protein